MKKRNRIYAPTPRVDSSRGAPMGRASSYGNPRMELPKYLHLVRVKVNSGGYDPGGAYWGLGMPLYWCGKEEADISVFFRAMSRKEAKMWVLREFPCARFYN
jgi:hypothetical protein